MTFLKIIVSIAIAVVLLVFLNNFFAKVFPQSQFDSYYMTNDPYKKCEDLSPYLSGQEFKVDQAQQDKYDKCIKTAQQESNDKIAMESLCAWSKGVIVLIVLVVVAILLFKRFPFYSSALIGCGLLFLLTYPTIFRYGGVDFLYVGTGDLSESIKNQVAFFKLLISLVGFVALSAADLFFFEKHHSPSAPIQPTINSTQL